MKKYTILALIFSFYSSNIIANPACFSNNEKLGDSAYWSITAIELFDQKRYEEAVAVVDLCFDIWGPEAKQIQKEIAGLKKLNKEGSFDLTTRLKYMITSINGESDRKDVRSFVDNQFLAIDSRTFRDHVRDTQPDVDLTFFPNDGNDRVNIPIGLSFFWPDV